MKSTLSKEAILEFKRIYFDEFHQELTDEEASSIAEWFLRLINVIYPYPINEEQNLPKTL